MSVEELLANNEAYVANKKHPSPFPPMSRDLVDTLVITCYDPRLETADFLGTGAFSGTKALVVRNAGGKATDNNADVLLVSQMLFGVKNILVIQHTDCGALTPGPPDPAAFIKNFFVPPWKPEAGETMKKVGIKKFPRNPGEDDVTVLQNSLKKEVEFIRSHPLVRDDIKVYGAWLDHETGKLTVVEKPE